MSAKQSAPMLAAPDTQGIKSSDWCEVAVHDVPPIDLVHLGASINLSNDYLDSLNEEDVETCRRSFSYPVNVTLLWLRRALDIILGSLQKRGGYLSPIGRRLVLTTRRLSMFTGVVAPVVLGQFAQIFLRGGELIG
ncbi:hypothetical protein PoB_002260400 [Plakobranchus ocellatus]|uniref:Uncharacterized protein n=1 Tax=Plakobranchus ocellatus TaxID=259542 RepID=A0AAV3ZQE2_9GAST|nr:hypothetical protein PoB_002260400 [Plakobranchus ocellatus]